MLVNIDPVTYDAVPNNEPVIPCDTLKEPVIVADPVTISDPVMVVIDVLLLPNELLVTSW